MSPTLRLVRRPSALRTAGLAGLALAAMLLATPALRAQEPFSYTATVLGGIGGSFDADPDPGWSNSSYRLGFAVVTEPRTWVGARVGKIDMGDERLGDVADPTLEYANVAAEYHSFIGYYDSALVIGVGGYRLKGIRGAEDFSKTGFGAMLGSSGEFRVTEWLGVVVDVSVHWADLKEANLFGTANAGLAVHF